MIPVWLKSYLTEADLKTIEAEVRRHERKTSGEVVTIVVQRSTPLGYIGLLLGSLFGLGYFILEIPMAAEWGLPVWQNLLVLLACCGVGFLLAKWSRVQRALIPLQDQALSVARRAELELYHTKATKTKDRTAILIFVSMMERRAVILGDVGIAAKIPQQEWHNIVSKLVQTTKSGDLAGGLVGAIDQAGQLLATHFPIQPEDVNELSDALIIKP